MPVFRYQRGNRSLAANLSMSQPNTATDAVTPEVDTQEQEEDYDIPEEVETVIGQFLYRIDIKCLLLQYLYSGHQFTCFLQSICWWD